MKQVLTKESVRAEVLEIHKVSGGDIIVADALTENLWFHVLRAIANGAPNAQALAEEVLKTDRIAFQKYL